MDRRSLSMLGLVVLAAALPVARSTPERVTQAQRPGDATRAERNELFVQPDVQRARGARLLLDEYFQDSSSRVRVGQRPSLDVIIAAIPDPLDSHLDYSYDAHLAAMRQAFEVTGFITDRFWLPWPVDREKSELASRLNKIDTTTYRRQHPGIFLFRDTSDSKLRLLYVVGEVPTSGMHPAALDSALADRERALGDERILDASRHVLRIVGPSFTGGARALARGLERYRSLSTRQDSIDVISGSATGARPEHFARLGAGSAFHSTVHSDAAFDRVERSVLCGILGIRPAQIAVLRESSTEYGAVPPDAVATSCRGAYLDIPFPANIASLRTEYARTPAAAQAVSGTPGSTAARIRLNLEDPSRAMENPPVMSELTPAVLDGMLDQIAHTLSAQRIRAVGIMATDARDKLFLADQLRRRLHDITLFTTESDVLLLRRDVNAALRGMLVFSTYPLELDVQRWDTAGVNASRLVFSNESAEGTFNALRLQLDDHARLAEYGASGLGNVALYCEGTDATSRLPGPDSIPPVWVLTVGRSGFSPLTICPTGNTNALMRSRPVATSPVTVRQDAPFPRVPLALLAALALVVLFGRLEWRQFDFLCRMTTMPHADSSIRELDWRLLILHGHLYAILRVAALAVLLTGLGIGIAHGMGNESGLSAGFWAALVCCLVVTMVVILRRGGRTTTAARVVWSELSASPYRPFREQRDQNLRRLDAAGRFSIVLVAVGYVFCCAVFIAQIFRLGCESPIRSELFLHRAGVLNGGFSPAMILVCTGGMFALWSSWHINRIQLLLSAPRSFEKATLNDGPGTDAAVSMSGVRRSWESMREVRTHLLVLLPDGQAVGLFALLIVPALVLSQAIAPTYEALLFPVRSGWLLHLVTGDGTFFDFLARFGIIAALAATTWSLFRVTRVWNALRQILDELARGARATAFERMPRRVARLTRLNVFLPRAEAVVRGVSLLHWTHMRSLYGSMTADERNSLVMDLPDVVIDPGHTVTVSAYLERIMNGSAAESIAWTCDTWDTLDSRSACLKEEAVATSFLLRVTERAYHTEPRGADLAALTTNMREAGGLDERQSRSTIGQIRRMFGDPVRLWVRAAEELVAVQCVDYIQWVLQNLRYIMLYIIASLAILTQMLSVYVLRPASMLWLVVIVLVVAAVIVLLMLVFQINRNELLGRIAGRKPGSVSWDSQLILNVALIAAVPLLTFIGSALPWLRDGLFQWLDPVLRTLGRH